MRNGKRKKRLWKAGIATLLSAVLALPAPVLHLTADLEVYAEGTQADENGFIIEDGVLKRYIGTAIEVVIPEGVTSIGDEAFWGCSSLMSIEIPSSVTSIGDGAFAYCSLTSIEIPSSVTSIGDGAFAYCSRLTSIEIQEGVTSIGDEVFVWSSLKSIEIPSSVTSIGRLAFAYCSRLTSIEIQEGVTSMGDEAFSGCSGLKSIEIPSSVTNIGGMAFLGCSGLTSIAVEEGNTSYDSRNNCNAIIESSSNTLIAGCNNTIIPSGVTSIGYEAFLGCDKLTIYGEEGSYAQTYAKENNISFELFFEQSVLPLEKMTQLIGKNEMRATIFQTADGLIFTFKKGVMKLVNGVDSYDFGAEITKDYASLPNQAFTEEEFVFRINFNHSSQLPGEAEITIPTGSKWAGKKLYYYEIMEDGTYRYVCRSTIAADGSYTVKQSYGGNYVAVTKVPEHLGDCDGEDGVNAKDALAILKYDVGILQENFAIELADCDGEDGITANDALAVLKYDVGIITKFE